MKYNKKEVITMAFNRVKDCLINFSDFKGIFSDDAIMHNIERWEAAKRDKIFAIMNNPHYNVNEPFKVCYDSNIPRGYDVSGIDNYCSAVRYEGIVFSDRVNTYVNIIRIFNSGAIITKDDVDNYINYCANYYHRDAEIRANMIKTLTDNPPIKGQKVSKYVRKLAVALGFKFVSKKEYETLSDHEGYISEVDYANYADSINPTIFKRKCVLSVDPVDYLLMSNGNSWSSCYTINPKRAKGDSHFSGCCSAGTWSYMNDAVSMILYILNDSVISNYAYTPKIMRQVVMFNDADTILNSRLYPQSNDSFSDDTYSVIRRYSQQIIADTFNIPNLWKKSNDWNMSFSESADFVGYPDVYHFSEKVVVTVNSTTETPSVMETETKTFAKFLPKKRLYGANCFCPSCGDSLSDNNEGKYVCANCYDGNVKCEDCGEWVDITEAVKMDGNYYCNDCVGTCGCCGAIIRYEDLESVYNGRYWDYYCPDCLESDTFYCEYHERHETCKDYDYKETHLANGNKVKMCTMGIEANACFYCDDCEKWYFGDVKSHLNLGKTRCENCWEKMLQSYIEEADNEEA